MKNEPRVYSTSKQAIRYRQVRYGFVTRGFRHYILSADFAHGLLPIPDVDVVCGKRGWDRLVRHWRCALHVYDHDNYEALQMSRSCPLRRSWFPYFPPFVPWEPLRLHGPSPSQVQAYVSTEHRLSL